MNEPADDDPDDGYGPPAIPTLVGCLHCHEEYESYMIERRRERDADGVFRWWWCCPTPGCGGRGFGNDIFPVDPEWVDSDGSRGWVQDDSDDEDEFDLGMADDDDDDDDDEPDWDRPRKDDDDDFPVPF